MLNMKKKSVYVIYRVFDEMRAVRRHLLSLSSMLSKTSVVRDKFEEIHLGGYNREYIDILIGDWARIRFRPAQGPYIKDCAVRYVTIESITVSGNDIFTLVGVSETLDIYLHELKDYMNAKLLVEYPSIISAIDAFGARYNGCDIKTYRRYIKEKRNEVLSVSEINSILSSDEKFISHICNLCNNTDDINAIVKKVIELNGMDKQKQEPCSEALRAEAFGVNNEPVQRPNNGIGTGTPDIPPKVTTQEIDEDEFYTDPDEECLELEEENEYVNGSLHHYKFIAWNGKTLQIALDDGKTLYFEPMDSK